MGNGNGLYLQNFVWKRLSDRECVRYVMLTDLTANIHAVQSTDFFRLGEPFLGDQFDKQFVELFSEIDPKERCLWRSSLIDAINAHESEFSAGP